MVEATPWTILAPETSMNGEGWCCHMERINIFDQTISYVCVVNHLKLRIETSILDLIKFTIYFICFLYVVDLGTDFGFDFLQI